MVSFSCSTSPNYISFTGIFRYSVLVAIIKPKYSCLQYRLLMCFGAICLLNRPHYLLNSTRLFKFFVKRTLISFPVFYLVHLLGEYSSSPALFLYEKLLRRTSVFQSSPSCLCQVGQREKQCTDSFCRPVFFLFLLLYLVCIFSISLKKGMKCFHIGK